MNKITEIIDQLLENYSFEELTIGQRQLVLSEMTQYEYVQMREVVLGATSLGDGLPPLPKDIRHNLRQDYRKVYPMRDGSVMTQLGMSILGLALGALFTVAYFSLNKMQNPNTISEQELKTKTDTIYLVQTDTVYLTILSEPEVITKEVIRYIERPVEKPATQPLTTTIPLAFQSEPSINNQLQDTLQDNYFNNIDLADILPMKVGKTIGEESELMNLLTEMPSDGLEQD